MENSVKNTTEKRQIYLRFKCTDGCNFYCSFCHKEGIEACSKAEMELELFERIISVIQKIGLLRVKFTGGEPTLCGKLAEYIRICENLNIEDVGIVTNGSDKEVIHNLQYKFPKLKLVISIPGFSNHEYHKRTGGGSLESNYIMNTSPELLKKVTINHIVLEDEKLDNVWLESIIELSKKVEKVKLLVPCNVDLKKPQFDSESHHKKIKEFIIGNGFIFSKREDNHIYYTGPHLSNIIIIPPYCPEICASVGVLTLRMTTDGKIKPCFVDNENKETISIGPSMTFGQIEEMITQLVSGFVCPFAERGTQYEC
jgi:molybdenum cofactor biosynthesis enzyme MoaA